MDTWKPQWWSFYLPGLHAFPFLENNASTLYFQWPGLYLANTGVYWCHQDATLYWSSGIFKCFPYVTLWICSPFLCLHKFDPPPMSWVWPNWLHQVSVFTLFTLGSCLVTACNPLILELAVIILFLTLLLIINTVYIGPIYLIPHRDHIPSHPIHL